MASDIPAYDANLDTNTNNIFESREQWKCLDFVPIKNEQIDQKDPKDQEQKQKPAASTSNLYCTACKKKFSNEATWQNHLRSSKHIANEKKKVKQPSSKASSPAKPKSVDAIDPRVEDIRKQLEKILQAPPSQQKHQGLWSISKSFFELRRPQDTSAALQHLIQSTTGNLQYQALLALGRLLYLYKSFATAYQYLLKSLECFWNIKPKSILSIAKDFECKRVELLMDECRICMSSIPKTDESNNVFVEIANMFSSTTPSNKSFENVLIDGISIVLLMMASFVERIGWYSGQDCLRLISRKYEYLEYPHRASETLMLLYNNGSKETDLFKALLLALEIGDLVRAEKITYFILGSSNPIPVDLQLLVNIAWAKRNLDHAQLESSITDDMDYLLLLLEQNSPELVLTKMQDTMTHQDELVGRLSALLVEQSH